MEFDISLPAFDQRFECIFSLFLRVCSKEYREMTTGAISWQDSGKGPVPLTLEEANRLALLGNFVFPGDSSRANLQSK